MFAPWRTIQRQSAPFDVAQLTQRNRTRGVRYDDASVQVRVVAHFVTEEALPYEAT